MKSVILSFLLLLPFYSGLAEEDCGNVYVWSVSQKEDYIDASLLYNITNQIETALISNSDCRILERRKYSDLEQHSNNEQQILSFEQIPESSYKDLTIIEAQRVVLGEVLKDEYNGNTTYTLSLSITDLATKVIIAKSETYFTPMELLQPNERLKKINALIESMLNMPPKANEPNNGQLKPNNPRVKLRTMGVDWSVKNFAEALYSGDMQVAELFLAGGMSPIARYNDASVVLYGFARGALRPADVLTLMDKYGFNFSTNLFDGSIMKSKDRYKALPYSYDFNSHFKPPNGYSAYNHTFEGNLLLWLYQTYAYFGCSQEEINLLNRVKEKTGRSEQLLTFINQHQVSSRSEERVKSLFSEELNRFNEGRGKTNQITLENFNTYRPFFPHTISALTAITFNKVPRIRKHDELTVLQVRDSLLAVKKIPILKGWEGLAPDLFQKDLDTTIYWIRALDTDLIQKINFNYINDISEPYLESNLENRLYSLDGEPYTNNTGNRYYFFFSIMGDCEKCNSISKPINDFLVKNRDRYIPVLISATKAKIEIEKFRKFNELSADWLYLDLERRYKISYDNLGRDLELTYLNSILFPERRSTPPPYVSIIDKYGIIQYQRFSLKTFEEAWFEDIDK